MKPMFAFSGITGGYGQMKIIQDVSGEVLPGECSCILGRNGVGKSTLLKLLAGQLPLMSGEVTLENVSLSAMPSEARQKAGVSYAMQERSVFDTLSVAANLTLMRDSDDLALFDPYFEAFPILNQRQSQKAGTLSGGERKILSFTRAMAEAGRVTLLDEPSEGVQPENIARMGNLILAGKSEGRGYLIVEQNMALAWQVADHIYVVDRGAITFSQRKSKATKDQIASLLSV